MADGVLWEPSDERIAASRLREYLDWLEMREGRVFPHHDALWTWSVEDLARFWTSIVEHFDVQFSTPWEQVVTADPMPRTRWFTGARLNWARHALRHGADDDVALVCVVEGGAPARSTTWRELRQAVASMAAWLRQAGVQPGDASAPTCPTPSTR